MVIIGAGLVGALAAISFAREGYNVAVFESRPDPRLSREAVGRSINLAVSARGLGAIKSIDEALCARIVECSLPMKGRMIHVDGQEQSQIYGLFGECINSIDRTRLNIDLLDEAAKFDNVNLHFDHKLIETDLERRELKFRRTTEAPQGTNELRIQASLTIGCDGAYSAVRTAMMRLQRMDFSQEYIQHAYLELSILPGANGDFSLDKEHLHIWPRQEFMLIALPNPDGSFTSTLFAPFALFESLKTSHSVVSFFQEQFPDALELIGEDRLLRIWEHNPIAPLIQIKCSPYHYKDRAILLGDSTHAMVPFYGQGMNCGFEDLRIFNQILRDNNVSPQDTSQLGKALESYSNSRHEDLLAILKLAMGNYVEMRSSVTSRLFLLRKHIDNFLGRVFRNSWVPMYSMVSFRDDISYSQVVRRQARQSRIIETIMVSSLGTVSLYVVSKIWRTTSMQHIRDLAKQSLLYLAANV